MKTFLVEWMGVKGTKLETGTVEVKALSNVAACLRVKSQLGLLDIKVVSLGSKEKSGELSNVKP